MLASWVFSQISAERLFFRVSNVSLEILHMTPKIILAFLL